MEKFLLEKMESTLVQSTPQYSLNGIKLNEFLGKNFSLSFSGILKCTACFKIVKKHYGGSFCYPCSIKLPEADICILKPELCHFAKGTCRDENFGQTHCNQKHFVYLSQTSGLKIGITRATQIPTRWIDQGAIKGLAILKVSTRFQSGRFEKLFNKEVLDKTDWRKMLKEGHEEIDLVEKKEELFFKLGNELDELENEFNRGDIEFLDSNEELIINYPVLLYPKKIQSINLLKVNEINSTLQGIKGQYLIFEDFVFNVRGHTGFEVNLNI